MKKVLFFLVIIFLSIRTVDINASAEYELVMDAKSGRVLYEKNGNKQALIASTTKIMTALVVLNNIEIDTKVTVGEEVLKAYGSAIYIKSGEILTIEDLLYGLMLRSGNDAALTLAYAVGGSIEGFAELMNETAHNIGMFNTIFQNPHGLDEETQNKSTVYDMALLMREAMKNPVFQKITSAKKYILKTNMNTYEWYNKNKLLTNYKYATGGKIGYTTRARHTFVSSASKDNKELIVATFKDNDRFNTHETLHEKFFDIFESYKIIEKDDLQINFKKEYKIYTLESYEVLLKKDEIDKMTKEIVLYDNVSVTSNPTIIGNITIKLNGESLKKMNIYAEKQEVIKRSFWDKIKDWFK